MIPQLAYDMIVLFTTGCTLYMVIYVDWVDTEVRKMKFAHRLEVTHYKQMLRK
jgi:hypothetical protein